MVSRNAVGVLVIGVLGIVGLGLTAATVASTTTSELGHGGQYGPGPGDGEIDYDASVDVPNPDPPDVGQPNQGFNLPDICIQILTELPAILGLVIGFLAVIAITYRQRGFISAGFVGYLFGIPLILGYGLVTQCNPVVGSPDGDSPILSDVPVPGDLGGSPVPPAVLLVAFAVAAVVAIGVVASAAGRRTVEPESWDADDEPELESFAAVAGDAVDVIESTDVSVTNAVYRAWLEMTRMLDVDDPDTTTAGEFAEAAVDAGVSEADAAKLTRLFEEVRYGDMEPGRREDLALETLRAIEDTYGDDPDADA